MDTKLFSLLQKYMNIMAVVCIATKIPEDIMLTSRFSVFIFPLRQHSKMMIVVGIWYLVILVMTSLSEVGNEIIKKNFLIIIIMQY